MTTPRTHKPFHLSERVSLLLLSLVTGVCSGLAAVLLLWCIDGIKSVLDGAATLPHNLQYLFLPGIGMLLSLLLLRFVVRDDIGHGVTKVLLAVSRGESKIKRHNIWSSLLTSALTIGFGGSVGAEAPIVYTGAAIGSNLGRRFSLSYRSITVLLGCGAAGAVAGIFKAPLAGVLFTMEILLFNISLSSMLPLLISTVSATVVTCIFHGQGPMFPSAPDPFALRRIPYYILLGVLLGLASLYFIRATLHMEDKLARMRGIYLRWAVCAVLLGGLVFFLPQLYGEGYGVIGGLLQGEVPSDLGSGWLVPLLFLLVFFMKVPAMAMTCSGGGVGGTFGPTLFCGGIAGFAIARSLNLLGAAVPEQNFVLVGMAALMAGVMQAPMTAIFLIAEISGGYALLIPLIITSTVSYGTVRIFEKRSIYTKRIAQSGDLLTHEPDQAVLTLLSIKNLVRDKYPPVGIDDPLRKVVQVVMGSNTAVLPVLDREGRFQGMIDVGNIRRLLLRTDLYDRLRASNIMEQAPALIQDDEKMESVMAKFDKTGAWRLPVLTADRKYLGFISRSRLLTAYRNELKEISNED